MSAAVRHATQAVRRGLSISCRLERHLAGPCRLSALPGLYLAGNGYRGVSVASLVEDAERVAGRMLAPAAPD